LKEPFNALDEGFPLYGLPLGLGAVLIVLGVLMDWTWILAFGLLFLLAGAYVLFFFRDPHRSIPSGAGVVVSGADGKVVEVKDLADTPYYRGPCKRVSVFLSLFNVHVNRAPISGTVEEIEHRPGQFLDARLPESSDRNESTTIRLATEYGPVTVRQVAGLVARRIVCKCEVGDELRTGERFGMIKFGSRTEVYLPPDAEVTVRVGESVQGGASVIARFE
jgi:phosphatidylserine decarboxylase